MTFHHLVRQLGGDLYAGGRRANIPAPGHSRADRSVSLMLSEDRVVVHCFGAANWREVRDHLQTLGLIDGDGRLSGGPLRASASVAAEPPGRDARRATATALWRGAAAFDAEAPAGRYCLARAAPAGLNRPWALRSAGFAPVSVYRPGARTAPALLCAIQDPGGAVTAVEITYLTAQGQMTSWLRTPRKAVGVIAPGSAVRLSPAGSKLLVGEGVFTTLSAMARFGLPGWALLSTRNLRRWAPPPEVKTVLIAADRGEDGETSASVLARSLRGLGVEAAIRLPPPPFGDWNDWARAEGK